MRPEQDEFRRRAIRAALAVAGIAAVIGLVIGGLTSTVVYVSGVLPEGEPSPSPTPTVRDDEDALPTPRLAPTPTPSPGPETTSPSPSTTASPSPSPTRTKKPEPRREIRLDAGTANAGSFERITLRGRYPGGNGRSLQVQRRESGSWARFPTSATVSGGSFRTYVASGQPGPNPFRVVDPATGATSNVVVVQVS